MNKVDRIDAMLTRKQNNIPDRLSIAALIGCASGYFYEVEFHHAALVSLLWTITLCYVWIREKE